MCCSRGAHRSCGSCQQGAPGPARGTIYLYLRDGAREGKVTEFKVEAFYYSLASLIFCGRES